MKIISKLLLGLLLIAPGLQASEVADEIVHALEKAKVSKRAYTLLFTVAVRSDDTLLTEKLINHADMEEFHATAIPHPFFDERIPNPEIVKLVLSRTTNPHVKVNKNINLIDGFFHYFWTGAPSFQQGTHMLLDKLGVAINTPDSRGFTILHYQAAIMLSDNPASRSELIKLLLQKNADAYIGDSWNVSEKIDAALKSEKYKNTVDFVNEIRTLCDAQRPRRIAGLQAALYPYLNKDTAGIVIGYTREGVEEEQARQAKSGALTKISE